MKIIYFLLFVIIVCLIALFVWSRMEVAAIETDFPPSGSFLGEDGRQTHFVDVPADNDAKLPPVLIVHGASGNLKDPLGAFAPKLRGSARMIFIDRPGHGYSDRADDETPAQQAERYKLLLDGLNIDQVVLVGHSLGSASVAAFAVLYPDRVKGLVFVAPATHPWPGGVTWYYDVASIPLVGELFTETVLVPAGLRSLVTGAEVVFEPQSPPKNYVEIAAIPLALRPKSFRANARDVAGLNGFAKNFSVRYKEITAPTVIITGDKDDIVAPSIHSIGLERDIQGAELIVIQGLGHKPDYEATDVVIEAIHKVAK